MLRRKFSSRIQFIRSVLRGGLQRGLLMADFFENLKLEECTERTEGVVIFV